MNGGAKLRFFVLIDALGWRLLEGQEFLNDVLTHRAPLRTVLGFSSGAIPSILTGLPPAKTGHWNLIYYDPKGSPFRWLRHFSFLSDRWLDNRVSRNVLKAVGRHMLGLGPLFECCVSPRSLPWFNWVEKRNIYGRGGISSARSIFDQLAEERVPYRVYSYHQCRDREILRRARRDLKARQASFYFLYLSEVDHFLHLHCQNEEEVARCLSDYARELRRLFEMAREQDPEASFTVFSDHGMTPVRNRFDVAQEIEGLGFSMPVDYLAVYDSTMARFWFFSERARRRVVERLESLPCGRIVPDDELQQLGVLFPDRRYGEVIFLVNPGWILSRSDFHGRGWAPVGMHGYHPDDPYSDAVFLSDASPPMPVQTITDVYQCMREAVEPGEGRKPR